MKREPGAFLRRKFRVRAVLMLVFSCILAGIGAGMLLQLWLPRWATWVFIALGAIFWRASRIVQHKAKWSLDNLEKGMDAETEVGQHIEYAIASLNCAVAHNVQEIAKAGDIDHLVATPVRLWVVETKANRVSRKEFQNVLRRIARNVQAVRTWAPSGTEVSGCLTLAQGGHKPSYKSESERILAESPASLMRKLRVEARKPLAIDKDLPRKVWALGKADEK